MQEKEVLAIADKFGILFSYIDKMYDVKKGRTIKRWILLLPGSGCSWGKKKGGGCLMCGAKSLLDMIRQSKQFSNKEIMDVYRIGKSMVSKEDPENLTIYNGGSFLNDGEIPLQVQLGICRDLRNNSSVQTLFVESRPEFVTEGNIKSLVSTLEAKELMVGIGLECLTDKIREKSINKGMSKKDYETAIKVLKHNDVEALTYVFIKPLYLTEREAIDEAINTAKYAFSVGTDEVAFEAAFVQEGTEMERVYRKGEFRPPWLWSIIEVIQATHHLGRVRVGDFRDEPPPIAIPHNCEKCSHKIRDLFQQYKNSHNISLFSRINCRCKDDWIKELNER